MFGGLGSNNNRMNHKVLNDNRLTPAQKSAYAFDQGICETCGVKTHWIGPFKRRPYTNERVCGGICRTCRPSDCDETSAATARTGPLGGTVAPSFEEFKKMAIPPDVLLARTSTAFSKIQTGVTQGVNKMNDNIKAQTEKLQQQQKQNGGINIFGSSRNSQQQTSINGDGKHQQRSNDAPADSNTGFPSLNVFGASREKALKNPRSPKTAFSDLKSNFQASDGENKEEQQQNSSKVAAVSEDINGEAAKGMSVTTPFGKGKVVDYRQEDDIYVIDLHHKLTNNTTNNATNDASTKTATSNNTKLFCKKESFSIEHANKSRQKQSMELNEAYESLEKMRRLNLELECQDRGIGFCDFNMCTICLLNPGWEQHASEQEQPQNFRRIRKLLKDQQQSKPATPCLFCAAPSCVAHSSPVFRKEGITACADCVKLFESDYIVGCINQAHGLSTEKATVAADHYAGEATRERPLDHLVHMYDRVLLLLQYSSQYIDSIATALEENTKTHNNVNVGASSVGIVSGALGVAAAASIFTPAGPPLLVASLMLGGGATTVQTGTEVVNYFSEPNKFADKIIALVGMLHSLLRVKENLREALTARLMEEEGNPEIDKLKKSLTRLHEKQREAAVIAGTTMASAAALGGALGGVAVAEVAVGAAAVESAALVSTMEAGAIAGRQANMLTKGSTAVARGARFARFAGGTLSFMTLVLEARTMSTTIEQINAGHPCEKADALRSILKELPSLPTTEQLDDECRIYIGAMSNRVNAVSLEDAINLIESKAMEEWEKAKKAESLESQQPTEEIAPQGASILDGEEGNIDGDTNDTLALSVSYLKEAQQERRMAQSLSGLPPAEVKTMSRSESDEMSALTATPVMSQSMTHLPSDATSHESGQSALLERIQKFKEQDGTSPSSAIAE